MTALFKSLNYLNCISIQITYTASHCVTVTCHCSLQHISFANTLSEDYYLCMVIYMQCVIEASISFGISCITRFYTWLCSPQA